MNNAERESRRSRRRGHFSLAQALGVVTVVALGLAAISQATEFWLVVTNALTVVILTLGFLGVLLRTRPYGAWVGFTVFGWACFLYLFVVNSWSPFSSVIDAQIDGLTSLVHKAPVPPSLPKGVDPEVLDNQFIYSHIALDSNTHQLVKDYWAKKWLHDQRGERARWIDKLFACQIIGFLGSIAGRLLAARREPGRDEPGPATTD